MNDFHLLLIIAFAAFTQSTSGFGFALVAMPLLKAEGVPIEITAPLVALLGLTNRPLFILRYYHALDVREIRWLSLSAVIAIPLGVYFLQRLDASFISRVLGVVVILFVLVNLVRVHLPPMKHRLWAVSLGFTSGLLGGAYNIAGPPAVIYATGQCWYPEKFKVNLQTFALISSVFITLSHFVAGHYTGAIIGQYVLLLPAMLLGLYAGFKLDGMIHPVIFRYGVLILLFITGLRLFG